MDKIITFAVPCYNSADYMDHCIETLLSAGEDAEIILVDDGSTRDDTPAKCDEWAAKHPDIIRAIHQENGGHGEGVNQGIRNARGLYYKVVDSDDWLDTEALQVVLNKLREAARWPKPLDLFIANYVYDLVKIYNQFYHDCSILKEEDAAVRSMRLELSRQTSSVIKTGMGLLGIDVPERM